MDLEDFIRMATEMWAIPEKDPPMFSKAVLRHFLRGATALLPDPDRTLDIVLRLTAASNNPETFGVENVRQALKIIGKGQSQKDFHLALFLDPQFLGR